MIKATIFCFVLSLEGSYLIFSCSRTYPIPKPKTTPPTKAKFPVSENETGFGSKFVPEVGYRRIPTRNNAKDATTKTIIFIIIESLLNCAETIGSRYINNNKALKPSAKPPTTSCKS